MEKYIKQGIDDWQIAFGGLENAIVESIGPKMILQ
jgi:hypothetical protein